MFELEEVYCPAIRSIRIVDAIIGYQFSFSWDEFFDDIFDVSDAKNDLSVFFNHCHGLEGLTDCQSEISIRNRI